MENTCIFVYSMVIKVWRSRSNTMVMCIDPSLNSSTSHDWSEGGLCVNNLLAVFFHLKGPT